MRNRVAFFVTACFVILCGVIIWNLLGALTTEAQNPRMYRDKHAIKAIEENTLDSLKICNSSDTTRILPGELRIDGNIVPDEDQVYTSGQIGTSWATVRSREVYTNTLGNIDGQEGLSLAVSEVKAKKDFRPYTQSIRLGTSSYYWMEGYIDFLMIGDSVIAPWFADSVKTPWVTGTDSVTSPWFSADDSMKAPWLFGTTGVKAPFVEGTDSLTTPYLNAADSAKSPKIVATSEMVSPYIDAIDSMTTAYVNADSMEISYLRVTANATIDSALSYTNFSGTDLFGSFTTIDTVPVWGLDATFKVFVFPTQSASGTIWWASATPGDESNPGTLFVYSNVSEPTTPYNWMAIK